MDITKSSLITTTFRGAVPAKELREKLGIPATARVFVEVPRGGDYSGQLLDLDEDIQLHVEWIEATSTP